MRATHATTKLLTAHPSNDEESMPRQRMICTQPAAKLYACSGVKSGVKDLKEAGK